MVGCEYGQVVRPEYYRAHVALRLDPSAEVDADGHQVGGVRLIVEWHRADVIEHHETAFCYLVGLCQYGMKRALLFHYCYLFGCKSTHFLATNHTETEKLPNITDFWL